MQTFGLVDEHPIIRLGLQIFLRQHFQEIVIYSSGSLDYFSKLPAQETIDLIIFGLNADSKLNWLKQVEHCKYQYPKAVLIVHGEVLVIETVLQLLKLGVKGIVFKQNDPNELLDCIKKINNGHIYLSPELEKMVHDKIIASKNSNKLLRQNQPGLHVLTLRQYLLATYLIKGMKTSEIARQLKLTASTISSTKSVILKKMKVTNVIELGVVLKNENHSSKNHISKANT
ncbi:LuxR C-terminal-related transcriptional regulator [Dyadobacter subterraneus]